MSKGRYSSFVLNHRNTLLIPSAEAAMPHISPVDTIVVTPIDAGVRWTAHGANENMCLVKIYLGYDNAVLSYWEPKATTKTLASVIFRYYRHSFRHKPWQAADESYTSWTDLTHSGDENYRGCTRRHWEQLCLYFTREHATGLLDNEPVYTKEDTGTQHPPIHHGMQPLVFKLTLGGAPSLANHKTLTRIGVLKQTFDAYINRLLAHGYQTHLGLITFRSTTSLT
jgi:hypothetical protein